MKLSIIIPFFNAEDRISDTIDSILNQKDFIFDYEIILCNDGSTDLSETIIKEKYALLPQVKYYYNANQGVYKTRNFGLEQVTGDYVWLIDADDRIVNNAFEKIGTILHQDKPDAIAFGHIEQLSNGNAKQYILPYSGYIKGVDYLAKNDGRLYLWTHIYSVSFLRNSKIKFLAQSFSLEDFAFNVDFFIRTSNVFVISDCLYIYNYNSSSISKKNTLENRMKQLVSSKNLHYFLAEKCNENKLDNKIYPILKDKLQHSIVGLFFSLLKENYPTIITNAVYNEYLNAGLLPIEKKYGSIKKDCFVKLLNIGLIKFVSTLYNTLNKKNIPQ